MPLSHLATFLNSSNYPKNTILFLIINMSCNAIRTCTRLPKPGGYLYGLPGSWSSLHNSGHVWNKHAGSGGGGGGGVLSTNANMGCATDMGMVFSNFGTFMVHKFAYFYRILVCSLVYWWVANRLFFAEFEQLWYTDGSQICPFLLEKQDMKWYSHGSYFKICGSIEGGGFCHVVQVLILKCAFSL